MICWVKILWMLLHVEFQLFRERKERDEEYMKVTDKNEDDGDGDDDDQGWGKRKCGSSQLEPDFNPLLTASLLSLSLLFVLPSFFHERNSLFPYFLPPYFPRRLRLDGGEERERERKKVNLGKLNKEKQLPLDLLLLSFLFNSLTSFFSHFLSLTFSPITPSLTCLFLLHDQQKQPFRPFTFKGKINFFLLLHCVVSWSY